MIPFEKAIATILDMPFRLEAERVPLMESLGRVMSESLAAPWPMPRFDNSAMDGIATRGPDVKESGLTCPVTLRLVGESAAGSPYEGDAPPVSAIRISTGALLPECYNTIVPIEGCEFEGDQVRVFQPVKPGTYVRRTGEDVPDAAALFGVGQPITPPVLSFLSSYNFPDVPVFRRPKVGILSSGNEIRPHGAELGGTQIVGSSAYYLERDLAACGCEVRNFGIARDEPADWREHFERALAWSDVVVTTAGVSVGEHDVVGRVIEELGGTVHFWKVAVRPGKPMMLTSFGNKVHFGLPGNPVSTCCNTEIFLKPFLRSAFRMPIETVPRERVPLAEACLRDRQRLFFIYARMFIEDGVRKVRPFALQSSGNQWNPALANALIVAPPGEGHIARRELVEVMEIRSGL